MIKVRIYLIPCLMIVMYACQGQEKHKETKNTQEVTTPTYVSDGTPVPGYVPDPEIPVKKTFKGRNYAIKLNPNLPGGEEILDVWNKEDHSRDDSGLSRINQLSPTVLLYQGSPDKDGITTYNHEQPLILEFMDRDFKALKTVDIWRDRPYKTMGKQPMTYFNFDAEEMEVIPYKDQKQRMQPSQYSLFTYVRSEGNHVIVNYELRSLKGHQVIKVQHTLRIYDLQGKLKYDLKDLPSVDGAVVSNDGKYMMYTFGGIGLANANSPFATIEREGWALMRLTDQKVVYQEYTDDGILAYDGISMVNNLINIGYSTPSTEIDYDLMIFFNEKNETIYKGKLRKNDLLQINADMNRTKVRDWNQYLHKFNFQKIPISEK